MPGDLILPEVSFDELGPGWQAAQRERPLLFRRISRQDVPRGPGRIVNDDIDRAPDRLADLAHGIAGCEAVHAAAFGEQVRDQDERTAHVLQRIAHALYEENRHEARVETPRADE